MSKNAMRIGKELAATGAVSVSILVVLFLAAPWVPMMLAMPFNDICIEVGSWMGSAFPSSGWGASAGDYMLGVLIFACFEIWVGLFVFVRLIKIVTNRRATQDADDSLSLQAK